MKVELVRIAYLPDVTLGWLTAGSLRLATLEEPWRPDPDGPGGQRREGALRESCVPDGHYKLHPHTGSTLKNVWRLENQALGVYQLQVPAGQKYGRSVICIHDGVDVDSILGCILTGITHALVGGRYTVTNSDEALQRLRAVLGTTTRHDLFIRPVAGTLEIAA
jgi:Family of unknown function (DUF5675)